MFCPTQLVMSVQGTFVLIDTVDPRDPDKVKHVPSNLVEQVRCGSTPVRTYNIVTPCTIEPYRPEFGPDSPNKGIEQPIRGVMTTFGFILPYPKGHRFSVWFTGGTLEMDGNKNEKWFQIFDKDTAPKRSFVETGKVFAAKLLMGASTNDTMDANGKLSYTLSRPMPSHIDLIYLDPRMQIFRGSSGTVYVHVRIPGSHAVQTCNQSNDRIPAPRDPWAEEEEEEEDDESTEGDFDDGLFHHFPQQQQRHYERHHHHHHSPQQQHHHHQQQQQQLPYLVRPQHFAPPQFVQAQCAPPQYVSSQPPYMQPIPPQPIQPLYVPTAVVPLAAPKARRVASESNLQNLCPGKVLLDVPSRSATSRKSRPSSSSSCIKNSSAYEAPKRAWYLDSEVA